jgi:hypothetical protein
MLDNKTGKKSKKYWFINNTPLDYLPTPVAWQGHLIAFIIFSTILVFSYSVYQLLIQKNIDNALSFLSKYNVLGIVIQSTCIFIVLIKTDWKYKKRR